MELPDKEQLKEMVAQAVEALNRTRDLTLSFSDAWLFSNSSGSNLHIQFTDSTKWFDFSCNAKRIFDTSKDTSDDKASGAVRLKIDNKKIILRIAYALFNYYGNMRNK